MGVDGVGVGVGGRVSVGDGVIEGSGEGGAGVTIVDVAVGKGIIDGADTAVCVADGRVTDTTISSCCSV